VNELAPRPHNSGHQSIEGNVVSQFEQHLRAIFNQPLGDTACLSNAIMVNVLGEAGYEGPAVYQGIEKDLKVPWRICALIWQSVNQTLPQNGACYYCDNDRKKAIEKARYVQETLESYCIAELFINDDE
jgi:5-(carboxyamino)imidazole ribonucleotide synthase